MEEEKIHVSQNKNSFEKKYIETLSQKEMKSYEIAKDHLGMSFQLDRSVGYLAWLSKQKVTTGEEVLN